MKKYAVKLGSYDVEARIREVEVERETDSSIWIEGRRFAKKSDVAYYYDTWEEAADALCDKQARRVSSLQQQLDKAKVAFEDVISMKK